MGPQAAYRKGGLQGVWGDLWKQKALRLHTAALVQLHFVPVQ